MASESLSFDLYHPSPLMLILSGPSAAGKDAVLAALKVRNLPLFVVVNCTTRLPRPGEKEGIDYFFVSTEGFQEMVARDELLEFSTVYSDYKGVPRRQVQQALASGKDVVLRVDVQGARKIHDIYAGAVLIFLAPPNEQEWLERFKQRATENAEDLRLRIETARHEMDCAQLFDYVVVNEQGKLDETVDTIQAIIQAEHHRMQHRKVTL